MSNKNKKIETPLTSIKKFNHCIDTVLEELDKAAEHFELCVLPLDEVEKQKDQKIKDEILDEIRTYALLTAYLLDHPMLTVLRQMREEQSLDVGNTPMKTYLHKLKIHDVFKHYKGTQYVILEISKDSNLPSIEYVTYTSLDEMLSVLSTAKDADLNLEQVLQLRTDIQRWTLPVSEFSKTVTVMENPVVRFNYVGNLANEELLTKIITERIKA